MSAIGPITDYDIEFTFDTRVYSLDTLKRTGYKLAYLGTFEIRLADDCNAVVYLKLSSPLSDDDLGAVRSLVFAEVIDQDLREVVKKETENIRVLLLANAFSKTALVK